MSLSRSCYFPQVLTWLANDNVKDFETAIAENADLQNLLQLLHPTDKSDFIPFIRSLAMLHVFQYDEQLDLSSSVWQYVQPQLLRDLVQYGPCPSFNRMAPDSFNQALLEAGANPDHISSSFSSCESPISAFEVAGSSLWISFLAAGAKRVGVRMNLLTRHQSLRDYFLAYELGLETVPHQQHYAVYWCQIFARRQAVFRGALFWTRTVMLS